MNANESTRKGNEADVQTRFPFLGRILTSMRQWFLSPFPTLRPISSFPTWAPFPLFTPLGPFRPIYPFLFHVTRVPTPFQSFTLRVKLLRRRWRCRCRHWRRTCFRNHLRTFLSILRVFACGLLVVFARRRRLVAFMTAPRRRRSLLFADLWNTS